MVNVHRLGEDEFERLPLVIEGESKEVRYAGGGLCVVRFKPTVYSFTANRCAVIPGSEAPRLRAMRALLPALRAAGVEHAYLDVSDRWALSRLVLPHPAEFERYGLPRFEPPDMARRQADALPQAPPVEVVVKFFHGGTSAHRYVGMEGAGVRPGHPLFAGWRVRKGEPYPLPVVRFDWRNPLMVCAGSCPAPTPYAPGPGGDTSAPCPACGGSGRRVADEAMPEGLADLFLDVAEARRTALHAAAAVQDHMGARDVVCYDLCLFIASDGRTLFGEVGPDCGRFRHRELGHLDKDVWRAGGSHADVLQKWALLAEMAAAPPDPGAVSVATAPLYDLRGAGEEIVVGTSNPGKLAEIARIVAPTGARVRRGEGDPPAETGSTFRENARLKAAAYARRSGAVAVAEDSGLCVHALSGLPGVHSARFDDCTVDEATLRVALHEESGRPREAMDEANNLRLLRWMSKVEPARRGAFFEVALCVAAPDGSVLFETSAVADGWVAAEARGSHGFGYDRVFVSGDSGGRTWAELDAARKDMRSHRARALAEFALWYARRAALRADGCPRVVVDGNDGTGKSTLVAALRRAGYDAADRGAPTKRTDDPSYPAREGEVYVILDAPTDVCLARLRAAGKSLDEPYHTRADLDRYRARFLAVALELPRCAVVDAAPGEAEVFAATVEAVGRVRRRPGAA